MTDTLFTSFAYAASGASATQTDPARWTQLCYNVKDYGATGNGSTDDGANIQLAIDAALVTGGTVYFPPGDYKIFAPLTAQTAVEHSRIKLLGAGSSQAGGSGSRIFGSFANYLIDTTNTAAYFTVEAIEGFCIENTDNLGGGVRIGQGISASIRNCFISARWVGVDGFANMSIENCEFNSNSGVGSIGLMSYQHTVSQCRFTGWDTAIEAQNSGLSVHGCSFEVNNLAIKLGQNKSTCLAGSISGTVLTVSSSAAIYGQFVAGATITGSGVTPGTTITETHEQNGSRTGEGRAGTYTVSASQTVASTQLDTSYTTQLQGAHISGCSFESNNTGIYAASIAGLTVSGSMVTANTGVYGETHCQYGIRIANVDSGLFGGLTVAGTWDLGGIYFDQTPQRTTFAGIVASDGGGHPWVFPLAGWNSSNNDRPSFIGCNNPTTARAFSQLPSGHIEGEEHDVTDANLLTVGTGSSSSITTTTLTVGGTVTGQFKVGDILSGAGVTSGTRITANVTGAGGAGTYTVSPSNSATGTIAVTASNLPFGYPITAGGGSAHVRVRYNGTGWTVVGM